MSAGAAVAVADATSVPPASDDVRWQQDYLAAHPGATITGKDDRESPSGMTWICITAGAESRRVVRSSLGLLREAVEIFDARDAELAGLRAAWDGWYEDIGTEPSAWPNPTGCTVWRARRRGGGGLVIVAWSARELAAKLQADLAEWSPS